MTISNNFPTSSARLGLTLRGGALVGATGLLLAATAMARAESVRFDIASQPLPAALRAFAGQAQMQLLYEYSAVGGVSGNAVVGELDKQTALVQLLRNTGFEIIYSSESAATIRPADKQVQQKTQVDESDRSRVAQVTRPPTTHQLSGDSASLSLEEVIVTARRREENIQTVPIAITAISPQMLEDNNITTVTDLQHLVPSMSGTASLTRDEFSVSIRGQRESNGRPGVVMYLNEVPVPTDSISAIGSLAGGPGLLFDLENVQVLKGPQGTLFGRESVGGAVLLQSARPKKEFGGRVQVGVGNYNGREVDAAINVPLVDDILLTRIAFNGAKRNGYTWVQSTPNHPNGIDIDGRDYWSVRGSVTFRPSDWFDNDTIATYQDYESNGTLSFLTAVNTAVTPFGSQLSTYLAQQQALGIRTHIPVDTPVASSGALFAISNVTNIKLAEDLKLRTIFGYDRAVSRKAFDGDATPLPLGNQPSTLRVSPTRQYTAEAQLLGKSLGGNLDWIAGAFYFENPFQKDYVLQTGTLVFTRNDSKKKVSNKSKALFSQGTYDLSALVSGLKATVGLRYTWDRSTTFNIGTFGSNCTSVPTVNCNDANAIRTNPKSSALTWTTGLDYQATPDTLLYLTSRRGYRAGGANAIGSPVPDYGPEYVLDYELGVKSDWKVAGRPVRTNAAVYYQDYTDIQVARSFSGVQSFTDNASSARLWGGELEALLSLTDNLQLGANGSYLNIKYTGFEAGVSAATIADVKAREKLSPKTQYGLSARYRLPLDQQVGDLSVQVNWNWQAAFQSILNVSFGSIDIPSYGLLNLAVNWDHIARGPLDASFFMSNVTNKEYIVGGAALYNLPGFGYSTTMYSEPRLYGVRLRYRFGAE